MEYLDLLWNRIITFSYRQQTAIFAGGILVGYILHIIVLKLRILRSRVKREGRNIVLIEQKNQKNKNKKDINAEYFKYIKTAQYSQNEWLENGNKTVGGKRD